MTRRSLRLGVAVACAALLAACAQVPTDGPVVEAQERGQVVQAQNQFFSPNGPQPGQAPTDIVDGFLVAMTATPLTTRTAAKFLSRQARSQWQPQGYWCQDYVADLDALVEQFAADTPVRLVGHSLGGNIVKKVLHFDTVRNNIFVLRLVYSQRRWLRVHCPAQVNVIIIERCINEEYATGRQNVHTQCLLEGLKSNCCPWAFRLHKMMPSPACSK